jgi:hypothetical protein
LIICEFIDGESQGIEVLFQKISYRSSGIGSYPLCPKNNFRINGFLDKPVMNNGHHDQGQQGSHTQHQDAEPPDLFIIGKPEIGA